MYELMYNIPETFENWFSQHEIKNVYLTVLIYI